MHCALLKCTVHSRNAPTRAHFPSSGKRAHCLKCTAGVQLASRMGTCDDDTYSIVCLISRPYLIIIFPVSPPLVPTSISLVHSASSVFRRSVLRRRIRICESTNCENWESSARTARIGNRRRQRDRWRGFSQRSDAEGGRTSADDRSKARTFPTPCRDSKLPK